MHAPSTREASATHVQLDGPVRLRIEARLGEFENNILRDRLRRRADANQRGRHWLESMRPMPAISQDAGGTPRAPARSPAVPKPSLPSAA